MAKKNIISDFSALKGKVTFSEKIPDIKVSTKVTPAAAPKPKESDMGLKIGQSVVLMDSDLRGRIIRLGKTVGIEIEDGLVIESAYGEFAVTDKAEIASLKDTKVKAKKTITASKLANHTDPDGSLTIDLHIEAIPGGRNIPKGQQLHFQIETFRKVVRQNLSHRGMKMTFIHGVGDGILKAAIRKELDEVLALRCSYSVGDPAVTIVTIR
ncbi:MAG: hypothetical protein E7113_01900 [Bacteroidales bacterium]|nr:hypothetical protein [Bacteroidales bacterium]